MKFLAFSQTKLGSSFRRQFVASGIYRQKAQAHSRKKGFGRKNIVFWAKEQ